jgi:hypothetical protein
LEHCDIVDEERFYTADGVQKSIAACLQFYTVDGELSYTAAFEQFDTADEEQKYILLLQRNLDFGMIIKSN